MLVVPHVGNSLPVVGAIAAGPLGIAAGLAAQGLLGRGLNEAALHWDLIIDTRKGGRITADGRVVMEDGEWKVG